MSLHEDSVFDEVRAEILAAGASDTPTTAHSDDPPEYAYSASQPPNSGHQQAFNTHSTSSSRPLPLPPAPMLSSVTPPPPYGVVQNATNEPITTIVVSAPTTGTEMATTWRDRTCLNCGCCRVKFGEVPLPICDEYWWLKVRNSGFAGVLIVCYVEFVLSIVMTLLNAVAMVYLAVLLTTYTYVYATSAAVGALTLGLLAFGFVPFATFYLKYVPIFNALTSENEVQRCVFLVPYVIVNVLSIIFYSYCFSGAYGVVGLYDFFLFSSVSSYDDGILGYQILAGIASVGWFVMIALNFGVLMFHCVRNCCDKQSIIQEGEASV